MSAAPELRPYQVDVIDRVAAEIAAGRRKPLIVAPTGSGKTVIAAAIIAEAAEPTGGASWSSRTAARS